MFGKYLKLVVVVIGVVFLGGEGWRLLVFIVSCSCSVAVGVVVVIVVVAVDLL